MTQKDKKPDHNNENTDILNNEEISLEESSTEVQEVQKELEIDYKDKYTRLLAEYTNFARQKEAEMSSFAKFANKGLLTKILDILDDIEAGIIQDKLPEETKSILNILKIKILQLLAMEGVLEIELNPGDAFDPEKCEVVQTMEDKDFAGKIVQVLRKGYTISDKVLRTAKVIAGK